MKRKNKFRVGQTVQSVYDPQRAFRIDRSILPERIFHEKGSDRWWTRNELQRLGEPENPVTSIPSEWKGRMRAKCAQMRAWHFWRLTGCLWALPRPGRAKVLGMRPQIPDSTALAEVSHRGVPAREWGAGKETRQTAASPSGFDGGNGVRTQAGVKDTKKQKAGPQPEAKAVSLGRHKTNCTVCAHEKCAEIEAEFVNWKSPISIATDYGLADRTSIYRHAHALGLFAKRQRNIRAALEKIIERAGEVEVTSSAVVAAVQAYAKINAVGQWIERSEHVNLNELFERMSKEELEAYAKDGTLPGWFEELVGATRADSHDAENLEE